MSKTDNLYIDRTSIARRLLEAYCLSVSFPEPHSSRLQWASRTRPSPLSPPFALDEAKIGCTHNATKSCESLGHWGKPFIQQRVINSTSTSCDVTGTIVDQKTAIRGCASYTPSTSPTGSQVFLISVDAILDPQPCIMYLPAFYTDSWVEISSQPSSSSLSSAGGDNEIVTTGLQIRHDSNLHRQRRRRRLHPDIISGLRLPRRPSSAAGSSQDEYDESESESDQVLSSSNEDITIKDIPGQTLSQTEVDQEDDSTALGTRSSISDEKVFTPQPNAFSHPPLSQTSRQGIGSTSTIDSYFPSTSSSTAPVGTRLSSDQTINPRSIQSSRARPQQPQTARSHGPCSVIGTSHTYQPDHDAALRASLSTLLSCAAAVRGTPKQQDTSSRADVRHHPEPTALRLVPESELFGADNNQCPPPLPARKPRASSPPSSARLSPKAATKRKARESSKDRYVKKSRAMRTVTGSSMDDATISPILMSWMISAGVVLVFSAISFSVGYAWGKEVGRFEGGSMGVGGGGAGCGREAMKGSTGGLRGLKGLRRLRWGTGGSSVRA